MKTIKPFSFKTALSTSLALTLSGTTVGCTVVGPGYDNQRVYRAYGALLHEVRTLDG